MKFSENENKLTIFFEGKVDSINAGEVDEEINGIISGKEDKELILNFASLDYISSAGLRIILKLMKKMKSVEVVDASSEIYEILEMTGFTQLINVKKAYKVLSVDGCKVIGEGAKGIVYRYNSDTIIKVYKKNDVLPMIQRERELAKKAFILGIPTAISYDVVKVGDSYASVFELLDCDSMSTVVASGKDKIEECAEGYAKLLKQIHTTMVNVNDMPCVDKLLDTWYKNSEKYLDDEAKEKARKLLDNLDEPNTMIHGDYHTNNVMIQKDELILIDMDTLSYGNPIVELAIVDFTYNSFNQYDENNSKDFLGINKEDAKEFYKYFLKYYFEGLGSDEIKKNQEKIELLSHFRILNHIIKRNYKEEIIKEVAGKVKELVAKVDDLNL